MEFFDAFGRKREINPIKLISSMGRSGLVYLTDTGEVLKCYKDGAIEEIDFGVVRLVQSLNLPNIVDISSFLYSEEGNVVALLMPYYESSCDNLLFRPSDFLVSNMRSILNSFDILAGKGIMACDTHLGNLIIGDAITVIDTDFYTLHPEDELKRVYDYNRACLNETFRTLLYRVARKFDQNENFWYGFYYEHYDVQKLCELLQNYNAPYDMLENENLIRVRKKKGSKNNYYRKSKWR